MNPQSPQGPEVPGVAPTDPVAELGTAALQMDPHVLGLILETVLKQASLPPTPEGLMMLSQGSAPPSGGSPMMSTPPSQPGMGM